MMLKELFVFVSINIISQVIDIVSGLVTIGLTIIVIFATHKYQKINASNNIDDLISNAKLQLDNMLYDYGKLEYSMSGLSKRKRNKYNTDKLNFDALIEDYLNALELGCLKYQKKQIDKKAFKAAYERDIKNVIEDETYSKYLTCNYTYISLTYHEWFRK